MHKPIHWTSTSADSAATNASNQLHHADCTATEDRHIQDFIKQLIDHAVAILPRSLRDDGRYLLFNWDSAEAVLSVVSSDDNKRIDGPEQVQACIHNWRQAASATAAEQTETLRYWIRDYLTTCPEFLHFSLIAVFCEGDRSRAKLL